MAEPTISGYHDLKRIAELAGHFGIPAAVIINKADLNRGIAREIEEFARLKNMPVIGSLAYDPVPVQSQIRGKTVMELPRSVFALRLETSWRNLTEALQESVPALNVI